MSSPLNVLLIEDIEDDALLLVRILTRGGYEVTLTRVETEEELLAALDRSGWDVIIADYRLPRFSAPEALRVVKERGIDLPFIIVSGAIGEETVAAVEAMRAGAHDYINKGNWSRLVPAIEREMRETAIRDERRRAEEALHRSEARFRRLVESNIVGVVVVTEEVLIEANEIFLAMIGQRHDDLRAGQIELQKITPPEHWALTERTRETLRDAGVCSPFEIEYFRKDGSRVPVLLGAARLSVNPLSWVAIVVDLTERKQSEREREDILAREKVARAVAEEAVQQRSDVLMMVSHDLKGPLTRIKGYAQLLQRQINRGSILDPKTVLHGLSQIETTSTAMDRQINELVDATRLRIGEKLTLSLRSTDLVELAREMVDVYQKTSDRHRIVLAVDCEAVIGNWDDDRLQRVIGNLLENALKYSPSGGTITVRVDSECGDMADWATLSVCDQGIGIPAADLPRIFGHFQRASNVGNSISGTGLGLAGVRQIVEQHGGTVRVESIEGQGSTFTVRLPRQPIEGGLTQIKRNPGPISGRHAH